jgi:hypothetical protein
VAKHGPAAFTSSAVRAVRFISPGKGHFHSECGVGLAALVGAAIYLATKLLVLHLEGMAQ